MSSGGGGVNYQAYDPSFKDAELSATRTKIRDETNYRAYKSAKDAENYAQLNLGMLNKGLELLDKYMDEQRKEVQIEGESGNRYVGGIMPDIIKKGEAGAALVSSNLLSYLSQAQQGAEQYKNQFPGG